MRIRSVSVLLLVAVLVAVVLPGSLRAHGKKTHSPDSTSSSPVDQHQQRDEPGYSHLDPHKAAESTHSDHHGPTHDTSIPWYRRLMAGFFGAPDIHPMLVHFPIVFLWTAFFFAGLSWWRNSASYQQMAQWLFWAGLLALPITAASGFWAVEGWGGGPNALHRNLMLITTGLAFGLFAVLRWVAERPRVYRMVMTLGLILVVTTLTLGADQGAWLVFEKGMGVKPAQHQHSGDHSSSHRTDGTHSHHENRDHGEDTSMS